VKKIFITEFDSKCKQKELFPLARPFLQAQGGVFGNSESEVQVTTSLEAADLVLISEPLTHRENKNKYLELSKINRACEEKNIFAYAFISGDYGKVHPPFSKIIYYRMGGFKKQLNRNNQAFFFVLNDQLKRIFNQDNIFLREKQVKPTVGFCGHATGFIPKLIYEKLKLARVNFERILAGDFQFEPLFSSAFERWKILNLIDNSKEINSNFILRGRYRAGAVTEEEKLKTTLQYYNNIINSDYVVCIRGSGNFSVRFFETLMMGRVPVFINTDCLLPLENKINWKNQVVWVEWNDRKKIAEKILDFHNNLTNEKFIELQIKNRDIWKKHFNINFYLGEILK
jgi:hypothetical protein